MAVVERHEVPKFHPSASTPDEGGFPAVVCGSGELCTAASPAPKCQAEQDQLRSRPAVTLLHIQEILEHAAGSRRGLTGKFRREFVWFTMKKLGVWLKETWPEGLLEVGIRRVSLLACTTTL